MKRFINTWGMTIALILAVAMALSPIMARANVENPIVAGSESYYNLRMAGEVLQNPFLEQDELQAEKYHIDLYHYFLALFLLLIPNNIIMVSIVLAFFTAFLFYNLLMNLGFPKHKTMLVLWLYLLSPIYIFTATTLTSESLIIFLIMLSLYLYSEAKKYENSVLSGASLLPVSLIALMDPTAFVVFLLLMLLMSYYTKIHYSESLLTIVAVGWLLATVYFWRGQLPLFDLTGGLALRNYVTDFGAIIGYSFFAVLLALVNITFLWKNNVRRKLLDISLLVLFLISTVVPGSWVVMNVIITIYAALSVHHFMTRKWVMPVLRDLTLLLLFSSLLFSSVSYANRVSNAEPTVDTVRVMEAIKLYSRQGVVLSDPENGFIIEYFTQKPVFLDELKRDREHEEKKEELMSILKTKSPKETKELLDANEITYFYLDEDMMENPENKGLKLVLDVSDNFIKLARFNDREAWLYIRV